MNKTRYIHAALIPVLFLGILVATGCNRANKAIIYSGTPFSDSVYHAGAQVIPGKLQCEYYDLGGEGLAFHDTDSVNSGSGALNQLNGTYLHAFRVKEAVDISYTKFQDPPIDNTPYNFVNPDKDQLYVGWTAPGEWIKYTIDVQQAGKYQLGLMYTANKDGQISFSVDDEDVSGPLTVTSTYVEADTVAWRQWHHWNYMDSLTTIELPKGIQTFTLHTVAVGEMNYEHINFKLVE